MRDVALAAFLCALLALACRRPFLFVLAYIYVDTVSPHQLSYFLLNKVPLSLIAALLALGAWALADKKEALSVSKRQWLMGLLLVYAGYTTLHAVVPLSAWEKWDWVWKTVIFAMFLPLTLRTKLRIEAALLFLVLSAGTIIINGGIKTVLGGGGYGQLRMLLDSNSGLFEGSTTSAIAISLIPIILWLSRFGTIFPPDWRTRTFCAALIFACLLIPVGTQARTGLVCIAVLAVLMLRDVKSRGLYIAGAALAGLIAVPVLPDSFKERMGLIQGYQQDSSATTRIAVWGWTWDYAKENPMGGGFAVWQTNTIQVQVVATADAGDVQTVDRQLTTDRGRAWHSAYFEMLGEQGFAGLFLFLVIHAAGLLSMERLRRRYRRAEGEDAWIAPLATALQHFQLIYLVGALFIAIAFQPFVFLMLGVQIGLSQWVRRKEKAASGLGGWAAVRAPKPVSATAAA